jgi:histidinol-phosphate aminotransferase
MGLVVYPSQTNFVLVRFPNTDDTSAPEADRALQGQGIIARRFAVPDFEDKLRFTMGLDDEMEITIAALGRFMGG